MSETTGNIVIFFSLLVLSFLFFTTTIRTSLLWRATVTPLASIIGSGFLISAPLVIITAGNWAVFAMLCIVTVAYFLGSALRYNIQYVEPRVHTNDLSKFILSLERASMSTLGIAYMISVAFYLKLLSIFTLRTFEVTSTFLEKCLTTSLLLFLGFVGLWRGLHILETLEKYAVNLKLFIIGTLVAVFCVYNIVEFEQGNWFLREHNHFSRWHSFRQILGIFIIIQGFETSRYMGQLYKKDIRIRTMKYAQILSGGIYIVFVAATMLLFNDLNTITETAVIDMSKIVAPSLPIILVAAAIMSQFSAAIADSIGSSGLLSEATKTVISNKQGVMITILIALFLTWFTNVFEIIVIATKAFAIYYSIQCLIASRMAKHNKHYVHAICFLLLVILMLMVVLLGIPIEENGQ